MADELTEALRGPVSSEDEELEEFGCAVGPEHVDGFVEGDAVSEVSRGVETTGVLRHAGEAFGVEFFDKGAGFGVGRCGVSDQ